MARLWKYLRVSTTEQADALVNQEHALEAYCTYILGRYPELTEVMPLMREAASAYKIDVCRRPLGKLLCEQVQKGDAVVVSRLDRLFRNARDFCNQMKKWDEQGVAVHFMDIGISSNTSSGKMLATIMVAVAEQFSSGLSERQKLAWAARHLRQGLFPTGNTILVTKKTRGGGSTPAVTVLHKQNIRNLRYLCLCRRISYWQNRVADSWQTCCDQLERARVRHGEIAEYRDDHQREEWSCVRITQHLRRVMSTPIPAVAGSWNVLAIKNGPDVFDLPRKKDGQPVGYKHVPKEKDSLYDGIQNRHKKRGWSKYHDCCLNCGRTDTFHFGKGLCSKCRNVVIVPGQTAPVAPLPRKVKPWSRAHPCCVQCGLTTSKHKCAGVCARCLDQEYQARKKAGLLNVT